MYRSREYKSVGGYVKQMREEAEKFKITDKNCLHREEIQVLVENKETRNTAWSKERKQRHAEMMRRYWDSRALKRPFRTKKKFKFLFIRYELFINLSLDYPMVNNFLGRVAITTSLH